MSAQQSREQRRSIRNPRTVNGSATNDQHTHIAIYSSSAALNTQNAYYSEENITVYVVQWTTSFLVLIFASEKDLPLTKWLTLGQVIPSASISTAKLISLSGTDLS
jgi:hypothetical protein